MKNVGKFLFSLGAWLALASYVSAQASMNYNISPMVSVGVLLIVTLLLAAFEGKKTPDGEFGVTRMETTNVVQWARLIIKHLFKDNSFLNYCVRADEFVVHNTAVVIPNPGAVPTVIKNNNSYPMTAVQRADNIVMYGLNTYTTVPTFLTLDELDAISYDKSESVYEDHFKTLTQECADDQVINWANGLPGATNVVYTTGDPTASLETGQMGSRNTCRFEDVKALQRLMNKNNVPMDNRILLMEANMYDQLTTSMSATAYKDFSREYDPKTGTMGRLFGFDIMTRSSVIMATAGLTAGNLALNALNAAMGATDNVGCLAWQKQSVELAMGNVHLFSRVNDPLYTGDISNVRIKAGGRVRRTDNQGVYALIQGTPAG